MNFLSLKSMFSMIKPMIEPTAKDLEEKGHAVIIVPSKGQLEIKVYNTKTNEVIETIVI